MRSPMDWKRLLPGVSTPLLLAGLVTACSQSASLAPSPIPIPGSSSGSGICAGPLDTATTVSGVAAESAPDGIHPISDAIVELFVGDGRDFAPDPIKETLTRADGRYLMCLPPPTGGSGSTGPVGQLFEVRVRKHGYRTASQSFRFAYSVWDYGGVEVNLELVPD
jgi:hypothetical protein